MVETILQSLGFREEEIKAYIALLEVGQITAGHLARKTGLPRSSLYGFLKRLQEKGLIVQSMKYGIKMFSAEEPEKINLLFRQRIEELENQQKTFKELLPELSRHTSSKFLAPKFQLFEGQEGLQHVLKDMLLYSNMETQAFWPIKDMIDMLSPDFFRYHNKERVKNNLYTRALWPANKLIDIKQYPYLNAGEEFKREIRIAPRDINFSMGYWLYGNKATFISSRKESFGFIIESKELAEMLLVQFEVLWNMSKPLNVKHSTAKLG